MAIATYLPGKPVAVSTAPTGTIAHNFTMKRSLHDWLDYQLHTHPQAIALGLERVREVAQRLRIGKPGKHVITVGGTNGKGSTVAFIEAIARAAGFKVGAFTSPHLQRYNERIRVNGNDVADAMLVTAFERIEAARTEIALTYFEFGTLAALLILEQSQLDIAILEVGLGGRLDAVNIIDADVAIITTVDLDHQSYLGTDRETIGFEKAGILRAGKPCILGEKDPPTSVLRHAYAIGAIAVRGHCDYLIERLEQSWRWQEPGFEIELPLPTLAAPAQLDNAAAAIAALRALPIDIPNRAIGQGICNAVVPGRLQRMDDSPEIVLDVAHNPQAAGQLVAWLIAHPKRTYAVFGALADKDIAGIVALLDAHITHWFLVGIHDAGPRSLTAQSLAERINSQISSKRRTERFGVADALACARDLVRPDERILVFGSFHTVAEALRCRS